MSCPNTTVCSSRTWAEHRKVPLDKFGTPFPSWEGAPRQARDTISFVGRCPSTSSGHHFLVGRCPSASSGHHFLGRKVPLDKLGTPFPWSEGAPRQSRDTISFVGRCPSASSGHHFLGRKVPLDKLGTPFPWSEGAPRQARDTISLSEMVEAGGVGILTPTDST